MTMTVPWAIALAVTGVLGAAIAVGMRGRGRAGAAPPRWPARVSHLMAGGLAGFMALALPPAWPLLAALVGMLIVRAVQARRMVDVGLLVAGFGVAWTLLMGSAVLNELTDPAVYAPDATGWLAFGVVALATGLTITIAASLSAGGRSRG